MRTGTPRPGRQTATTEGAIIAVASAAGIGRSQVWAAAKGLRDAGLWPVGAPGRSKSPRRPNAGHLGNLLVALAITQHDSAEVAADRVQAFRLLIRAEAARPGLTFGDALSETIDLASRYNNFRNKLITHQGPAIQLAPTQMAGALITIGPGAGRYAAADVDVVRVAHLMHVRSFGLAWMPLINGSFINTLADLLANFRAATAGPESESGASSPKEAPPSTRPSDESVAETPRADNRSPDSSDGTPRVCAPAIAGPEGGSLPPGAHHDVEPSSTDQA